MLIIKLSSSLSIFFLYFFYTFLFINITNLNNKNSHLVIAHDIFIYAGCSQEKYQSNSPFVSNLNSLLSSIITSSSQQLYNSYAIGNDSSTPDQESSIFGLYQCRGDLQLKECSTCVTSAVSQVNLLCPNTFGATLQLQGCYLRYDDNDFLGNLDISLRYNKCSKDQIRGDADLLRNRDDVLADLLQGGGETGFKISNSGSVEGFAQCLGDLSIEDCGSCVSEAVMKLKNMCGSAAAADVFLGQCYARYWSSGYDHSSDPSNDDQVGKTVAIIVGVLAGIAVFIVLLSFCRKAAG